MSKWVFGFGDGKADGSVNLKNLLGGKGANLAEMASLGLPVPPGFTISTEICSYFYDQGETYPDDLSEQIQSALKEIEKNVGAEFGSADNPLLVSVRSGARVSMPGMMDTVLNLGLNDQTVEGLAKKSGDARFAWDSYRRFIQMYGDVVLGVPHYHFEDLLENHKDDKGIEEDTDLTSEDWRCIAGAFKAKIEEELGRPFPSSVYDQLWGAVSAVFKSWQTERAKTYRRLNAIPEKWGTAVTVQAMVFGNMGDTSATGVAFTRNPSTGERAYYGEYLINAQGEDVVAGIRTPHPLTKTLAHALDSNDPVSLRGDVLSMEEAMPKVYLQLVEVFERLETHYRDMQDIEFTVQENKLWMLQTRSGKRTAKAALKIAVDLAAEGIISQQEAIMRVDPAALDQLLHPTLDPDAERDILTRGLPASPGAASGKIVFDSEKAEQEVSAGHKVILVRVETSPEDIHGMYAASGILTVRGGMTSHAAVVARGMGRPCVSGAGTLRIDRDSGSLRVADRKFSEGDIITIDGSSGEVMVGYVPTLNPELEGDFSLLMSWADRYRRMQVRTNADTPKDTAIARGFGAEGIGLCRTEHMFFDGDRITAVRQMILAESSEGRRAALDKLLPMQRADFIDIFRVMKGLPVTVRLLDPPLHEFLPQSDQELTTVALQIGVDVESLKCRISELHEFNPMLGHRGCRLAITYPEIYEMQARAVFEAAITVEQEDGATVIPEIMIPLVVTEKELSILRGHISTVADQVFSERGHKLNYLVGTMIELPRAALCAGDIAKSADFFSFGTNDLTQTALGISRDDAARFLEIYVRRGIFERDPFVSIDPEGVGALIALGVERGKASKPDIKLGICGEHGGDPFSINLCEEMGLDYVSCSPYRVPIARLAAAQAFLARSPK